MISSSTAGLQGYSTLSITGILIRVLCIFAGIELIYQIVDLLTNSRDTVYVMHNWYYTYSIISTFLAVPVLILIWRLKTWALPVLLVLTAINQAMWFSFGVWDYKMIVFPILFLLIWLWHITGKLTRVSL